MKLPSMIPPILDTPFINAVTPAPRSFPLLSPKLVDTGPVKIESDPQLPNPISNRHSPKPNE